MPVMDGCTAAQIILEKIGSGEYYPLQIIITSSEIQNGSLTLKEIEGLHGCRVRDKTLTVDVLYDLFIENKP